MKALCMFVGFIAVALIVSAVGLASVVPGEFDHTPHHLLMMGIVFLAAAAIGADLTSRNRYRKPRG